MTSPTMFSKVLVQAMSLVERTSRRRNQPVLVTFNEAPGKTRHFPSLRIQLHHGAWDIPANALAGNDTRIDNPPQPWEATINNRTPVLFQSATLGCLGGQKWANHAEKPVSTPPT